MSDIKSQFKLWQHIGIWVELPLKIRKFAAGEVQVEIATDKIQPTLNVRIEAFIKDSDGLMILCQIKSILERLPRSTLIDLDLQYLPYSRYDRPMTGQYDAASLEVFTGMINYLDFNSVRIYDNHSDVGTALLKRCTNVHQADCINELAIAQIFDITKYDALVIPDAGAKKKVDSVAKLNGITRTVLAEKTRNLETNAITGTEVYGDVKGLKLLICDDIIDGGRTFIELAKVLKERGAASVDLYTTFGIFSYGIDCLRADIDKVYCHFVWKENIKGNEDGFVTYLKD